MSDSSDGSPVRRRKRKARNEAVMLTQTGPTWSESSSSQEDILICTDNRGDWWIDKPRKGKSYQ